MKKNWLRTIISTWHKQVPITYESLGLLQRNKDFWTPLEQANKMMSRFLLLRPSFTKKEKFKKSTEFFPQYANMHPMYSMLYTAKFRLVRLCPVFADPVTYGYFYTIIAILQVMKVCYPVSSSQHVCIWLSVCQTIVPKLWPCLR